MRHLLIALLSALLLTTISAALGEGDEILLAPIPEDPMQTVNTDNLVKRAQSFVRFGRPSPIFSRTFFRPNRATNNRHLMLFGRA